MSVGDEAWFIAEASGWRARALKAEERLAALSQHQRGGLVDGLSLPIGASFRRDLDAWVLYDGQIIAGQGNRRIGQIDGFDRSGLVDFILSNLRAALSNSPVVGEDAPKYAPEPDTIAEQQRFLRSLDEIEREQAKPTPTDTADRREAVARIIDPLAFQAWKASYDYSIAQGDSGADARKQADWSQKKACDEALAKADAIVSLIAGPPEGKRKPKWADDSDPVGEIAIKLSSCANMTEEEHGEWTWRDLANCVADMIAAETQMRSYLQSKGGEVC